MVAKAAVFGASTLVALSAPTSLAIERATACGVTLIAIARPDHAMIFSGPGAEGAASGGLAA
jgi:FdhD protein